MGAYVACFFNKHVPPAYFVPDMVLCAYELIQSSLHPDKAQHQDPLEETEVYTGRHHLSGVPS